MSAAGGRLGGRAAVVTGGASGLGEATVARLAAAGARVIVADIDEAAAARVAGAVVKAGGVAEAVAADVRSEEDVQRMVGAATGGNGDGRLDVLVSSAAGGGRAAPAGTSDEEGQPGLDGDLQGPFLFPQPATPAPGRSARGSALPL